MAAPAAAVACVAYALDATVTAINITLLLLGGFGGFGGFRSCCWGGGGREKIVSRPRFWCEDLCDITLGRTNFGFHIEPCEHDVISSLGFLKKKKLFTQDR